jgi:hypothetical protein
MNFKEGNYMVCWKQGIKFIGLALVVVINAGCATTGYNIWKIKSDTENMLIPVCYDPNLKILDVNQQKMDSFYIPAAIEILPGHNKVGLQYGAAIGAEKLFAESDLETGKRYYLGVKMMGEDIAKAGNGILKSYQHVMYYKCLFVDISNDEDIQRLVLSFLLCDKPFRFSGIYFGCDFQLMQFLKEKTPAPGVNRDLAEAYIAFDNEIKWSLVRSFNKTIELCDAIINQDSKLWFAYYLRGECRERRKEMELAEQDLKKCIKLTLESKKEIQNNWIFYREFEEAIGGLYRKLAKIETELGKKDEAEKNYYLAISMGNQTAKQELEKLKK